MGIFIDFMCRNRLKKNGYTLVRRLEDYGRKIADVPYSSGKMNYIDNEKFEYEKIFQNVKAEECQLREEFRMYRSSLNSSVKSNEIQRLLNSRVFLKDKNGFIVRDPKTGVIQYIETFQRETYDQYSKNAKKLGIETTLIENEFQSAVIYTNMIDEAEGRTFLLRARVENLEELSNIVKNKRV